VVWLPQMNSSRNSKNPITDSPLPLLLHCLDYEADGWELGPDGKHPLRMIRESELDSFLNSAKTSDWSSHNPIERRDADLLLETVALGESLMRKKSIGRLISKMRSYAGPQSNEQAGSVVEFCSRVNQGIGAPRVVIWWSRYEKRLLLGIHCGQVPLRALYVLTVARLGQPGGLAECENCGKFFRRGHKKEKRFCNSNCRSAFTMRKLRAKAHKTQRKEHHGTTQTR
jgi:hypothetical protein